VTFHNRDFLFAPLFCKNNEYHTQLTTLFALHSLAAMLQFFYRNVYWEAIV